MKTRKASGWAFVVAFNIVAIAAVLGVGELGARWIAGSDATYQDEQLPMCRPDPLTIWRYRPDIRLTYRAPEFETQIRTNEVACARGRSRRKRRVSPPCSSSAIPSPSAGAWPRSSAIPRCWRV